MVSPSWSDFQTPQKKQLLEPPVAQEQKQQQQSNQSLNWENFQTPMTYQKQNEDESSTEWWIRNIASNASRVGEQIAGGYGNVEKFAKDVLVNLPQSGGVIGWALSELVGPERWERLVRGPGNYETILPTSSQFKEASQKLSKGYTKPKTQGEERFQEYVEDFGASLRGRGLSRTPRQAVFNHVITPISSNVAKDIVENVGFDSNKGNLAKGATWLAMSLMGNVNAPRYASELTNQGRQGIPNTAQFDVARLQNRIANLRNSPQLMNSDPRSALARQQLDALERDLANGQTSVRSLMTAYDGINAAKRNRDLFSLTRSDQNYARRTINLVRDAVRDEIMTSSQAYPDAINSWRNGIQAWATIHQSNAISNFVERVAKGPYAKVISGPALGLFGIGSYGASKAPMFSIPGTVAIPAAYKGLQVGYRVLNDPTLSNYYWNAIRAAQQENIPVFLSNYEKLNKKLSTDEKPKK